MIDCNVFCFTEEHCYGFSCNDGSCIPSHRQCDGKDDCSHGEDELECGEY